MDHAYVTQETYVSQKKINNTLHLEGGVLEFHSACIFSRKKKELHHSLCFGWFHHTRAMEMNTYNDYYLKNMGLGMEWGPLEFGKTTALNLTIDVDTDIVCLATSDGKWARMSTTDLLELHSHMKTDGDNIIISIPKENPDFNEGTVTIPKSASPKFSKLMRILFQRAFDPSTPAHHMTHFRNADDRIKKLWGVEDIANPKSEKE